LAVTACGEEPTGPETAGLGSVPAFAKPPGTPGGGGNPAGDIALEVVFTDGADNIRSDGNPIYVHEQEFVSAIIRPNGMLYFQSWKGKRKNPVLRGVTVDLGSPDAVFNPDDLAAFAADVGSEWPVFTSDVTLHTRDTNGGLYTMDVGSTLVDGGKIGFNDYGDGNAWEWRLLFDARADGVADRVGLCLTHPDADTWLVTADAEACNGAVDGVTELWRVEGSIFTHVADFNTPMHLTLNRS
jgi:hypothetical protein